MSAPEKVIRCMFVAGGKYHDIDFARLEILKLLGEDERIRTRVFEDYSRVDLLKETDILITYTCDVMPSLDEQEALRTFVQKGGKWFALHGTNAILRFMANGDVLAPRWAPHMMETLGSQFIAHPPIQPYTVEVADPDHPLVEGVEPFETTDELYLMDLHGDHHVLLDAEYGGDAVGFIENKWEKQRWPVLYIHEMGKGAVLYLTLGHCRGHYDMQPLIDYYPEVERCAWEFPVYYTLLRRGINWAHGR